MRRTVSVSYGVFFYILNRFFRSRIRCGGNIPSLTGIADKCPLLWRYNVPLTF